MQLKRRDLSNTPVWDEILLSHTHLLVAALNVLPINFTKAVDWITIRYVAQLYAAVKATGTIWNGVRVVVTT